jgi:Flp pilus assembly protein TadB
MSKERARRRAEERARKNAPHTKAATTEAVRQPKTEGKQVRRRSARAERQRRRLIAVVVCWAAANVLIWVVWQSWQAVWIGLTITTVAAPVIAWLLWDPEGRVDL